MGDLLRRQLLAYAREIVLGAVKQNAKALWYDSVALKNDKEIVLMAVRQTGCALQYASDALKNDRGIVIAAMNQDRSAPQHSNIISTCD